MDTTFGGLIGFLQKYRDVLPAISRWPAARRQHHDFDARGCGHAVMRSGASANLPSELERHVYSGGEHTFCHRYNRTPVQGQFSDFGVLDRRELANRQVKLLLAEQATPMGSHAFSTGAIKRTSFEQVLPNTMVEYKIENGARLRRRKIRGNRQAKSDRTR